MAFKFNPFTGKLDIVKSDSELDAAYLKLDQTTPQSVINGVPYIVNGIKTPKIYPNEDAATAIRFLRADGTTSHLTFDTRASYAKITAGGSYPRIYFGSSSKLIGINTGTSWFDIVNSTGNIRMTSGTARFDITKNVGPTVIDETYYTVRDNNSGYVMSKFGWSRTYNQLTFSVSTGPSYTKGNINFIKSGNDEADYNHDNNDNPTIVLYSSTPAGTATDQWLSLNHSTTYGEIKTGVGHLYLNANNGKVGVSVVSPTARLHLPAGTATAGTAPFKFTSGTLNTTAESGAVEFLTDDYYATITTGAARKGFILNDGTNLTSGRIPYATTNGRLTDNAGFTYDGTNLKIGDGTNYTQFEADGIMTMVGTARVLNSYWIDAGAIKAPGVKPASQVDWGIGVAWEFSDGTDDTLVFNMKIADRMDRTVAPTISIGWSSHATEKVGVWQLEYLWTKEGEDTTSAAQETLETTGTTPAQADGLVLSTFTGIDVPDSDDVCLHCRLKRLGADGDDTLSDTAELHGICMSFTTNKIGIPL